MTARWSGRTVTKARAHWARRLPVPCRRCGRPVTAEQRWHVGHIVDRALGGSDDLSNTWPEHEGCNLSAGGQLGARITNARRRPKPSDPMLPESERRIRG